jgi:ABC-type multidrug transport system fused ATPase/permease subunit
VSTIIAAVLLPGLSILLGSITGSFSGATSYKSLYDGMKWTTLWIVIVGVVSFIFSYAYFTAFQVVAEQISFNLRSRYLTAFLKQEVGFFEKQSIEQLPS